MDERIAEIVGSAPYAEPVSRLRCFRGVDYLSALAFVVEGGNFRRFATAASFMGFLRLVPSERSSGSQRLAGCDHQDQQRASETPARGGSVALSTLLPGQ